MLVSVITVAYNSADTIGDTIESVLNQTYSNIEYLIIDGKSSDNTIAIAEEYRKRFEEKGYQYRVVSEKDNGIYDAMNKGIKLATGEIIGLINSDDWYESEAVATAVEAYHDDKYDLFYADMRLLRQDGKSFIKHSKLDKFVITSRHWNHPTTFITKKTYDTLGVYDCKHRYHADFELLLRAHRAKLKFCVKNTILANFRLGGESNNKQISKCIERFNDRYSCYRNNGYSRLYFLECIMIEVAKYIIA